MDGGGGAEDTDRHQLAHPGMWVQHVESSLWASGSGGTVQNNFFTSIWADGCNLNNVVAHRHVGQQPDRDQQLHPRHRR